MEFQNLFGIKSINFPKLLTKEILQILYIVLFFGNGSRWQVHRIFAYLFKKHELDMKLKDLFKTSLCISTETHHFV